MTLGRSTSVLFSMVYMNRKKLKNIAIVSLNVVYMLLCKIKFDHVIGRMRDGVNFLELFSINYGGLRYGLN